MTKHVWTTQSQPIYTIEITEGERITLAMALSHWTNIDTRAALYKFFTTDLLATTQRK